MIQFPLRDDKKEWRHFARAQRQATDTTGIAPRLRQRLASLPEWQAAKNVLLYHALPGETDLIAPPLLEPTRILYLPRCAPNHQLTIHEFLPGQTPLIRGAFGLWEPDPIASPEVDPTRVDLVVVPALLFSEQGERLGYGGGFYDRFLPRLRLDCLLVGILPDTLIVPALPTEPHDTAVDIVLTETRTIRQADRTIPTPLLD